MKPGTISLAILFLSLGMSLTAQVKSVDGLNDHHDRFRVTSATFENDSTLPISVINNITIPPGFPNAGSNGCSIDGAPGGNESPELSWTDAPRSTRSFAVVAFDETANFTHWGMYNIPADTTELPQNAGVAGSTLGEQVLNDSSNGAEYYGPCPPPNYPPNVHHYVFTVLRSGRGANVAVLAKFPSQPLKRFFLAAGNNLQPLLSQPKC